MSWLMLKIENQIVPVFVGIKRFDPFSMLVGCWNAVLSDVWDSEVLYQPKEMRTKKGFKGVNSASTSA